jgi:hypothetical protein
MCPYNNCNGCYEWEAKYYWSFLCFFYIVEVFYCMAIGKVSIVLAIIEFFIAFLSSLFFGYK